MLCLLSDTDKLKTPAQWCSQGLPGLASRPPWRQNEDENEEKLRENKETYRKLRKNWRNILILSTKVWEAGFGPAPADKLD